LPRSECHLQLRIQVLQLVLLHTQQAQLLPRILSTGR
jgi:hypothetical protein